MSVSSAVTPSLARSRPVHSPAMTIPRNTFSGFVLIINEFGQARSEKSNCERQKTELFEDGQLVSCLISSTDNSTRFGRMAKIKLVF